MSADEIGAELARHLKKSIEGIPNTLSSLVGEQEVLNLKDIDPDRLVIELVMLTYVSRRAAVQLCNCSERNKNRRREICNAFDKHVSELLQEFVEFDDLMREGGEPYYDLLDERGKEYVQLLQSHRGEDNKINWESLCEDMKYRFEQFCRGGGGEGQPIILGDFFSMVPLFTLATRYWMEGFVETAKYLKERDL